MTPPAANTYAAIMEWIFDRHYTPGATIVAFDRDDIVAACRALRIAEPRNLGDVVYRFRYRATMPASIEAKAPPGTEWIIRPAGRSKYRFEAVAPSAIAPNPLLVESKVPDATPGVVGMYSLNDEQALLARLRYNRLIDLFLGIATYSLQNHLRTTVKGMGQVETDEVYVGIDRRGAHYVVPVQAKGGRDALSIVQIEQDVAMCAEKFPGLICRPVAAQFMAEGVIALFEFDATAAPLGIVMEKHYRLVPGEDVSDSDLAGYAAQPL